MSLREPVLCPESPGLKVSDHALKFRQFVRYAFVWLVVHSLLTIPHFNAN